jgi:4-hydroxybenzoate polyprenyltransferase
VALPAVHRATGALLVAELGLFIVYCFPPFRLKERAFWGIAADATYAHALPAVLAMLTFALMASEPYRDLRIVAVTLGAWQFAVGMRNIALHQLHDRERDARAGARTLAITFGAAKLERLLRVVFVPLEIATFAVFLVVLTRSIPCCRWPVRSMSSPPLSDSKCCSSRFRRRSATRSTSLPTTSTPTGCRSSCSAS